MGSIKKGGQEALSATLTSKKTIKHKGGNKQREGDNCLQRCSPRNGPFRRDTFAGRRGKIRQDKVRRLGFIRGHKRRDGRVCKRTKKVGGLERKKDRRPGAKKVLFFGGVRSAVAERRTMRKDNKAVRRPSAADWGGSVSKGGVPGGAKQGNVSARWQAPFVKDRSRRRPN